MLQFEKMTVKAQEALRQAQEVAARHENQQIEPLHLLEALVAQKDGVVSPLLARLGIRAEGLNQENRARSCKAAKSFRFRSTTPGKGAQRGAGTRLRRSEEF
jgi:ATP-dependent Clp protease ATP-binding subunit ClpB